MLFVGIDISKKSFNVSALDLKIYSDEQFENNNSGFNTFIKWISKFKSDSVFCLESTGIYSLALAKFLHQKKFIVILVNPIKTHAFSRMEMTRSKTDKADAQSIARFCKHLFDADLVNSYLFRPQSKAFEDLRGLIVRLEQISISKSQEINHLEAALSKAAICSVKASLNHFKKQQINIEDEIRKLVILDPQLSQQVELLISIPSIGEKTAWRILAYLGDIALFSNSKQVTSYAGLNPKIEQSGTTLKKSKLSKMGHKRLRKSMYMPALVATKHHPKMVKLYQQLQAKGKPKKVAIAAIMRKLLVLSYGVLKSGKKYDLDYQN